MSGAGDCHDSNQNGKLCDLMIRLKLENPELGRKSMFTAVQAEGAEWTEVKLDRVKRTWKKMMTQISKDQEENGCSKLSGASNYPQSTQDSKLCFLMIRLKLENPELEQKDMLTAIQAEGTEWKEVKLEEVKQNWKKMMHSSKYQAEICKPQEHKQESSGAAPKAQAVMASKCPALTKQLEMLKTTEASYVIFTLPHEPTDFAIYLQNIMGQIFYSMMWNRVIKAPWGSPMIRRDLWMIYQQLEASLNMSYKRRLRKQLQEEFGVDPFEGKGSNVEFENIKTEDVAEALKQL